VTCKRSVMLVVTFALGAMTNGNSHGNVDTMVNETEGRAEYEPSDYLQYREYVQRKIQRGLRDIEEGRVVDDAEVERRIAQWCTE
jgi:hypothetical protein